MAIRDCILMKEGDGVLRVCEGSLVHPEEGTKYYNELSKRFLKADKTARKLIVTTSDKKPLDLLLSKAKRIRVMSFSYALAA